MFKGKQIHSKPIGKGMTVANLVDRHFMAYNAARIGEICGVLQNKVLKKDVLVGVSMTGALTPAGLGAQSIVPLMENGFIDFLVSTGANLYHDIHFALKLPMHRGSPFVSDVELRKRGLIRIYDIIFDFDVLYKSDRYVEHVLRQPEFQKRMGSAELHYLLGKYVNETEKKLGVQGASILACAYRNKIPVYCPSPGDSTIGLNAAVNRLDGLTLEMDPIRDVNETTAITLHGTRQGKTAVLILGGGSPKNFLLQTMPQLDEIMEIHVRGHDYFIQITDARPDTGGLSGATPHEAVSWGKVDPEQLPDTVVSYMDTTVALPIITSYVLDRCKPRKQRKLYDRRDELILDMKQEWKQVKARKANQAKQKKKGKK